MTVVRWDACGPVWPIFATDHRTLSHCRGVSRLTHQGVGAGKRPLVSRWDAYAPIHAEVGGHHGGYRSLLPQPAGAEDRQGPGPGRVRADHRADLDRLDRDHDQPGRQHHQRLLQREQLDGSALTREMGNGWWVMGGYRPSYPSSMSEHLHRGHLPRGRSVVVILGR